jgi:hypothetical protein
MSFVPLVVLGLVALTLRWLISKARTTSEDVLDDVKGVTAGQHLPSLHADVRDVVVPRSMSVDADTERYRTTGTSAGGV